jgi:hypothetical protein
LLFSTNGGSTWGPVQPNLSSTTLTLGADGLYTIAVRVFSKAGNVATYTEQVRLDRAGPTISSSITTPGWVDVGVNETLSFSAADVDNVTSVGAVLDGTKAIASGTTFNTESLSAGNHTIVITATDALGNTSTTTISLAVHATVAGLTTSVNDGAKTSQITSSTTSSQLLSYLNSALAALYAGSHANAKTYLASFASYAQAQSGMTISAAYAALLAGWANDLISRL